MIMRSYKSPISLHISPSLVFHQTGSNAWCVSSMECVSLSKLPRKVSFLIMTLCQDPYQNSLRMPCCNTQYNRSPSSVGTREAIPRHIFYMDPKYNFFRKSNQWQTSRVFKVLNFEEKLDSLDLNSFQFDNIPRIVLLMKIYKAIFRIQLYTWGNWVFRPWMIKKIFSGYYE